MGDMDCLVEKEVVDFFINYVIKVVLFKNFEGGWFIGFFDIFVGFIVVDKVCVWVWYFVEKDGVKFLFGLEIGKFDEFLVRSEGED